MRQRPRKRKNVFKLPPEVTNLVFYPLEEKHVDDKVNQDESETYDNEKIQQAVHEVLNNNYKNRASDFYDEIKIQSHEEVVNSQSENSNSTSRNENDSLSVSNSVSYTYCDDFNQQNKIEKKKKTRKDHSSQTETDSQNSTVKKETDDNRRKPKQFYHPNNEEEIEKQFRRGAHYFCTFPKRKPNPVTPDMKRKIGKQREFEGKFNYYAGQYNSDNDYDEEDDFKNHQKHHHEKLNDYNKYDFNGHFRKKRHHSDFDENDDPRYYTPYIPETTINPRVVSEKRCKKIIGKKNDKVFKTLSPKKHEETFNYTNIFLPPKRFEKSIFYPKGILHNLESEESFLKHPNSPVQDKVKKYNNKLFESNIHFYDFDDIDNYIQKRRSQSVSPPEKKKKKNQDIHYDLRNRGYQYHLHYIDKDNKDTDNTNSPPQNFTDARRFPDNYLQSMADQ